MRRPSNHRVTLVPSRLRAAQESARDHLRIRTVKVELLRTGPSHNQLLSPLTPYLGICDGAEAGVVHVPFEHEAFLRRLRAMSVHTAFSERAPALRELGVEIARMLGGIPRLPGSLSTDASGLDELVHLRLVLSASELALLPFELTKVPISPTAWAENWLSLQVRAPVVVTRRTRDIPDSRPPWPMRPRILFIAADPAADHLPFGEHRSALIAAVQPFLKSDPQAPEVSENGRREQFDDLLTVWSNASFEEVARECARHRYTHIHLLAHGVLDDNVEESSYGLKLHPAPGHDDVISGERFASAFATLIDDGIHRPTLVTLATCDSGNGGSVLIPGASIAHVLHQAGIPLVVASQFPLSMAGSALLVRQLYAGLLRGDHPLPLLHRIRSELHGRLSVGSNDWASLVVYEALPADLVSQLDELRYLQSTRALHVAFIEMEAALRNAIGGMDKGPYMQRAERIEALVEDLPLDGPFRLECLGLRAGSYKRLAEASFSVAQAFERGPDAGESRAQDIDDHLYECFAYLEDALHDYRDAATGFLLDQRTCPRSKTAMHWLLGQQLCLSSVLGMTVGEGTWETARRSAEVYLEAGDTDPDGRRWAHGTLMELWMLKLTGIGCVDQAGPDAASTGRSRAVAKRAKKHAGALVWLARSRGDKQVDATLAQLRRYTDWWSTPLFLRMADNWPGNRSSSPPSWHDLGLCGLAADLKTILENRGRGKYPVPAGSPGGATLVPGAKPAPSGAARTLADAHADAAPAVSAPATSAEAAAGFLGTVAPAPAADAFLTLDMLPAGHGDCLWLEYGHGDDVHRVLIDCGTAATYRTALRPRLEGLVRQAPDRGLFFELFILSHIDDDHIGGGIELLKEAGALGVSFGDVWFNGWQHIQNYLGAIQGEQFSELLQRQKLPWNVWTGGRAIEVPTQGALPTCTLPGGLVLTLLTPDRLKLEALARKWNQDVQANPKVRARLLEPGGGGFLFLGDEEPRTRRSGTIDIARLLETPFEEDRAPHNGSSIAVLAEHAGKRVLLGADAHPRLLAASLRRLLRERGLDRLPLDAFKLPHHGSRNNLDSDLLSLLDCRNYLVSTDGTRFGHPDNEVIARVIRHGRSGETRPVLWFNCESEHNRHWKQPELQRQHAYDTVYPADDAQQPPRGASLRL